jgi:hypothetical protein
MNNQIIGQQHINAIYKLKAVVGNLRNVIEKDIERQLSYSNNMNLEDSFYDIQIVRAEIHFGTDLLDLSENLHHILINQMNHQ